MDVCNNGHFGCGHNRRERNRWKGTEYRSFVLYTGHVALRDVLKGGLKPLYNHRRSLSISLKILLRPNHCTDINVEYANTLLRHIDESKRILYDEQYIITHNVNVLIVSKIWLL